MFRTLFVIYPFIFTLSLISLSKPQDKNGIESKVLTSQSFNKDALHYTEEVILCINPTFL